MNIKKRFLSKVPWLMCIMILGFLLPSFQAQAQDWSGTGSGNFSAGDQQIKFAVSATWNTDKTVTFVLDVDDYQNFTGLEPQLYYNNGNIGNFGFSGGKYTLTTSSTYERGDGPFGIYFAAVPAFGNTAIIAIDYKVGDGNDNQTDPGTGDGEGDGEGEDGDYEGEPGEKPGLSSVGLNNDGGNLQFIVNYNKDKTLTFTIVSAPKVFANTNADVTSIQILDITINGAPVKDVNGAPVKDFYSIGANYQYTTESKFEKDDVVSWNWYIPYNGGVSQATYSYTVPAKPYWGDDAWTMGFGKPTEITDNSYTMPYRFIYIANDGVTLTDSDNLVFNYGLSPSNTKNVSEFKVEDAKANGSFTVPDLAPNTGYDLYWKPSVNGENVIGHNAHFNIKTAEDQSDPISNVVVDGFARTSSTSVNLNYTVSLNENADLSDVASIHVSISKGDKELASNDYTIPQESYSFTTEISNLDDNAENQQLTVTVYAVANDDDSTPWASHKVNANVSTKIQDPIESAGLKINSITRDSRTQATVNYSITLKDGFDTTPDYITGYQLKLIKAGEVLVYSEIVEPFKGKTYEGSWVITDENMQLTELPVWAKYQALTGLAEEPFGTHADIGTNIPAFQTVPIADILEVSASAERSSETEGTLNYTLTLKGNAADIDTDFSVKVGENTVTVSKSDFTDNVYNGSFNLTLTAAAQEIPVTVTATAEKVTGELTINASVGAFKSDDDKYADSFEKQTATTTGDINVYYTISYDEETGSVTIKANFNPKPVGFSPQLYLDGEHAGDFTAEDGNYTFTIPNCKPGDVLNFYFYIAVTGTAHSTESIEYTIPGNSTVEPEPENVTYKISGGIFKDGGVKEMTLNESGVYTLTAPIKAAEFKIQKFTDDTDNPEEEYGATSELGRHIKQTDFYDAKVLTYETGEDFIFVISDDLFKDKDADQNVTFTFDPSKMLLGVALDGEELPSAPAAVKLEDLIEFEANSNYLSFERKSSTSGILTYNIKIKDLEKLKQYVRYVDNITFSTVRRLNGPDVEVITPVPSFTLNEIVENAVDGVYTFSVETDNILDANAITGLYFHIYATNPGENRFANEFLTGGVSRGFFDVSTAFNQLYIAGQNMLDGNNSDMSGEVVAANDHSENLYAFRNITLSEGASFQILLDVDGVERYAPEEGNHAFAGLGEEFKAAGVVFAEETENVYTFNGETGKTYDIFVDASTWDQPQIWIKEYVNPYLDADGNSYTLNVDGINYKMVYENGKYVYTGVISHEGPAYVQGANNGTYTQRFGPESADRGNPATHIIYPGGYQCYGYAQENEEDWTYWTYSAAAVDMGEVVITFDPATNLLTIAKTSIAIQDLFTLEMVRYEYGADVNGETDYTKGHIWYNLKVKDENLYNYYKEKIDELYVWPVRVDHDQNGDKTDDKPIGTLSIPIADVNFVNGAYAFDMDVYDLYETSSDVWSKISARLEGETSKYVTGVLELNNPIANYANLPIKAVRLKVWEGAVNDVANKNRGTDGFEAAEPWNPNNYETYINLASVNMDDYDALNAIIPEGVAFSNFKDEIQNLVIWKRDITDTPEIDRYVSQFICYVDYGTGFQGVAIDAHSTNTYIDAIVDSKFWCQHSRMEPGMSIQSIYFIYDKNNKFDQDKGETPFRFMFSSDGKFHYDAYEQQPLNSDNYYITLSSGKVYDALKGTRTGTIDIPFIRHHIAKEGYSINLGKEVTLTSEEIENFQFFVKDAKGAVKFGNSFNLDHVFVRRDADTGSEATEEGAKGIAGTNSSIKGEVTFNKLVLLVEQNPTTGAYDQYTMHLVGKDYEPYGFIDNGYERDKDNMIDRKTQKNPKLKIWFGGDSEWKDLTAKAYVPKEGEEDDSEEAEGEESTEGKIVAKPNGNVLMFDFVPEMTYVDESTGVAKKTNIYYLPLPGGVTINGKHGNLSDMFNILDNEGYDISNPYQGSQVIYPNEWWCVNPSIGYDSKEDVKKAYPSLNIQDKDIREYDGFFFPPLPAKLGNSVVDLSWGVASDSPNAKAIEDGAFQTTIYGITMFKIMGYGYDVYAQTYKERPLYYLYAETDPEKAAKGHEKTAPIVLQVNDGSELQVKVIEEQKEVLKEPKAFTPSANNPTFLKKDNVRYYTLGLSQVQLSGNDDLNWLLCYDDNGNAVPVKDITFTPNGKNSISIVDVTGQQTWDAYGSDDKLTANKWSNYYSTYDEDAEDIQIDHYGDTEYFRLVLATNPDAVRYQILSEDNKIEGTYNVHYSRQDQEGHDAEKDLWIYPTVKLKGNFFARESKNLTIALEGETLAKLGVEASNQGGSTSFKLVKINDDNNEEDITDMVEKLDQADAFLEPGEIIFTYDLGEYFVDPTDVKTLKATVSYGDNKESSTDIDTDELPTASVIDVKARKLDDLHRPMYIESNETYYAQLAWKNKEHTTYDALPRTYRIEANELYPYENNATIVEGYETIYHNGTIDGDGWFTIHPDQYFTHHGGNDYEYHAAGYTDANTKLNQTDYASVIINYIVTPTFHYALPVSKEILMKVEDMDSRYRTAPTGEKGKVPDVATFALTNPYNSEHFYEYPVEGDNELVPVEFARDSMLTGVDNAAVDAEFEGETEIYTLQGVRVYGDPEPGIYIIRKGSKSYKAVIR